MKTHTDYFDAVIRCLMAFQYIEESLKMVLIKLESLTYFRIKEYTPNNLKPRLDSIQNAAMGRLIDMLKIYSDDDELIAELREIKKRRDQVAHQSLLMTVEEVHDREAIHIKASELEEMTKSADATLKKIVEKWKHLDNILDKISAEQNSGGSA